MPPANTQPHEQLNKNMKYNIILNTKNIFKNSSVSQSNSVPRDSRRYRQPATHESGVKTYTAFVPDTYGQSTGQSISRHRKNFFKSIEKSLCNCELRWCIVASTERELRANRLSLFLWKMEFQFGFDEVCAIHSHSVCNLRI